MANQRLYIRCKNCGQCICIARNFGGEYTTYDFNLAKLDDFFLDHFVCTDTVKEDYNDFELIDDDDDDFWEKYKKWESEKN